MGALCRVLIAEDEYIMQQGIRHLVDWEVEGFEIAGTVSNGRDALRLVEELRPHIVLTDVVMPVMNGVELTAALRERFPDIQVVVLSGYSDFEYVRGTFQGGAVDYILKSTLNPAGLLDIMRRAAGRVPGLVLRQGAPSPEAQLGQLLSGLSGGEIPGTLSEKLPHPNFLLLGLSVGRIFGRERDAMERLYTLLARCAQSCLSEDFPHLQVAVEDGVLLLVVNFLSDRESRVMDDLRAVAELAAEAEERVFFVVSEPFRGLELLRDAYHNTLLGACAGFFYHKGTHYLCARDVRPKRHAPKWDGPRLAYLLSDSRLPDALALLRDYLASALKARCPDELELKSVVQNALYQIIARLEDLGLDASNLAHLKRDCLIKIQSCTWAEELESTVERILEDLSAVLDNYGLSSRDANMENILAYIDAHYAESITLQSMAQHFSFSYSYLSSYFHSHQSEGFNDYLNKVRCRRAAELLRERKLSVSEVCDTVGYGDQSYFTKVFKRVIGRTPGDYRRTGGGGHG